MWRAVRSVGRDLVVSVFGRTDFQDPVVTAVYCLCGSNSHIGVVSDQVPVKRLDFHAAGKCGARIADGQDSAVKEREKRKVKRSEPNEVFHRRANGSVKTEALTPATPVESSRFAALAFQCRYWNSQ